MLAHLSREAGGAVSVETVSQRIQHPEFGGLETAAL